MSLRAVVCVYPFANHHIPGLGACLLTPLLQISRACHGSIARISQVKKYDSKAAVAGTPKTFSTGEDMVDVKVSAGLRTP